MAIKRYTANSDNSITNAYGSNLSTRGTGSNAGAADILETFSIYGQESSGSSELSRILIQFPVSDIQTDRNNSVIPASGSVSFFLNLYNAPHSTTLPRDFKLTVNAVNGSWEEGYGLDLDNYTDLTYDKIGSNWIRKAGSTSWSTAGGDIYTDSSSSFEQTFTKGTEDLSVNITTLVEQWISGGSLGDKDNNGVLIKLSASYEATSSTNLEGAVVSYYTKKFFARDSEFFFERPTIEARWDSSLKDQRGSFYLSSSLAPAADNLNTIFLYNYVRGKLTNIPSIGTDNIYVSIFSGSSDNTSPSSSALEMVQDGTYVSSTNKYTATGSHVSTGIYKCSFAFTGSSTLETIYDVWFSGSFTAHPIDASQASIQFHTGTIEPETLEASNINPNGKYVISMPYLKESYSDTETERFRLYVRDKNWTPNIYTKAQATPQTLIIESASYQVTRTVDQKIVIPYGTGSSDNNYSMLSYDVSGNYFNLDLSMLEAGYTYAFQYSFYEDSVSSYREQPYLFKFRVEKDEY
jgi:hypothetical protein